MKNIDCSHSLTECTAVFLVIWQLSKWQIVNESSPVSPNKQFSVFGPYREFRHAYDFEVA